tara:strand:+ start:5030 stop:6283 length:1254 start_codon:yes stop_codon:yes gene_type:complete
MPNGIKSTRYYFFSISNFFAAFGGGLILGKATDVIINPLLHGGSILAFFIGSLLGLSLLQVIPKKNSSLVTQTFSFGCGFISLMMYFTFALTSKNGTLDGLYGTLFFCLLTIRFSFWFFSRVKRASESSGKNQSIAWVEFGYYIGMVLGLITFDITGFRISLISALILDVILQSISGLLDIKAFRIRDSLIKEKIDTSKPTDIKANPAVTKINFWCFRMASSVVALTVGIQVIIFHFAHLAPPMLTSSILAFFYTGVALSAYACNKVNLSLTWNKNYFTLIQFKFNNNNYSYSFLNILVLLSALMLTIFKNSDNIIVGENSFFICLAVFFAAFLFELISLALLDRVGYEESQSNTQSIIMKTYGLMGTFSAIGFWILISFKSSIYIAATLSFTCILFALTATIKRETSGHTEILESR